MTSVDEHNMMVRFEVEKMIQDTVYHASNQTVDDLLSSDIVYSVDNYTKMESIMNWVEHNLLELFTHLKKMDYEDACYHHTALRNHLLVIKSELEFFDSRVLSRKVSYEELRIRHGVMWNFNRICELERVVALQLGK